MAEYIKFEEHEQAGTELLDLADEKLDRYQYTFDGSIAQITWPDDQDVWHCVQLLNLGERLLLQLTWWVEAESGIRIKNVPFNQIELLGDGTKRFYRDEVRVSDTMVTNQEIGQAIEASIRFPPNTP